MKKIIGLFVALVLLAGVSGTVFAAESVTGQLKVTVLSGAMLDVQFIGDSELLLGFVPLGGVKLTDRLVPRSYSENAVDFKVKQVAPAGWTAGLAAGEDTYVLQGVFMQWDGTPVDADFSADDIITTADQTSSMTAFAVDSDENLNNKGWNVPAYNSGLEYASERSMRFRFQAPTSLTTGADVEQIVNVTYTVVAH